MVRSITFGVTAAFVLLWLLFFAGPGTVEVATLAVTVVTLIWFATVDSKRLVDERGRPHFMLFGLALLGVALLVTAASLISSGTNFLTLIAGTAAVLTGAIRAIGRSMRPATREE